ncbi:MAG: PEP-CTERM sorting domain-containing protein [Myxococcota bacterium]
MRSLIFLSVPSAGRRFRWALLLMMSLGLVGVSSPALALITFNVDVETESGDGVVRVGDEVTLNVAMTSDGEPYYGISASVSGYETSRARFDRGVAVDTAFNTVCIPGAGCFAGISNMAIPLVEDPAVPRVPFFLGVTIAPAASTGADDFGIGGFRISEGDYHASLTFEMLLPGLSRFDIGAALPDELIIVAGGAIEPPINAFVEIYVVPEPSTALLMGLGLIGLCGLGRPQ